MESDIVANINEVVGLHRLKKGACRNDYLRKIFLSVLQNHRVSIITTTSRIFGVESNWPRNDVPQSSGEVTYYTDGDNRNIVSLSRGVLHAGEVSSINGKCQGRFGYLKLVLEAGRHCTKKASLGAASS